MGGGRCIFRSCSVSAIRNPGMHFFRFPSSDPQRFEKWIAMAGAESIKNLNLEKRRGKLVCGRHFRDEYFMNYKKDRLIRGKAIPTLMRVSKTQAYDYEQMDSNGKPKLITLAPPVSSHLIAPPGFKCPLGFEDEAIEISENENEDKVTTLPDGTDAKHAPHTLKREQNNDSQINKNIGKKPRILNSLYIKHNDTKSVVELSNSDSEDTERFLLQEIDLKSNDSPTYVSDDSNPTCIEIVTQNKFVQTAAIIETVPKEIYDEMVKNMEQQLENERDNNSKIINNIKNDNKLLQKSFVKTKIQLATLTAEYKSSNKKFDELNQELQLKQIQVRTKNDELIALQNELKEIKADYTKLHDDYKKLQCKYDELSSVQQQINTVSTSSAQGIRNTTMTALSKVQLFNGIKKYLSATMTALLRMQMFGSTERQWKRDERQTAVDVLGLGERVYRYFTDEWRFYLPNINDARAWINDDLNADVDEEL